MAFVSPWVRPKSQHRVMSGGGMQVTARRSWRCCAGSNADDSTEEQPVTKGFASGSSSGEQGLSAHQHPSVVRVQLTVLLENTAAWLAARQRGAPRATARQLERVRRLPPFFRDSSKSAPATAPASVFGTGASSASAFLLEPDASTRYRIVLFRAQTPEHAYSREYLVRALVSNIPRMGIGAAGFTAEVLERCGRAEILVADWEVAECCCARLLADGIMANAEPLI
jgi:hypothetical protein